MSILFYVSYRIVSYRVLWCDAAGATTLLYCMLYSICARMIERSPEAPDPGA